MSHADTVPAEVSMPETQLMPETQVNKDTFEDPYPPLEDYDACGNQCDEPNDTGDLSTMMDSDSDDADNLTVADEVDYGSDFDDETLETCLSL